MQLTAEKRKKIFDDFCSQSGIKSFAFLKCSVNVFEWSIWLILILICAALTIRGVVETCMKFAARPTITKVIVESSDALTLPYDPTLCLSIEPGFQKGFPSDQSQMQVKIDQFLESSTNDIEAYLNRIFNQTLQTSIKDLDNFVKKRKDQESGNKLLRSSDFQDLFNGEIPESSYLSRDNEIFTKEPGLQEFLAIAAKTLLKLSALENAPDELSLADEYSDQFEYMTAGSIDLKPFADLLILGHSDAWPTRSIKPVSLRRLQQLVGAFLCLQARVVVFTAGEAAFSNNRKKNHTNLMLNYSMSCSPENIVWMGLDAEEETNRLCIRFSRNQFRYRFGKFDNTYISLSPPALLNLTKFSFMDASTLFVVAWATQSISIDFSGQPRPTAVSGSASVAMNIFETPVQHINVKVLAKFKNMNLARSPCSETLSFAECRGLCRSMHVMQACKCWPFSWTHLAMRQAYPNVRDCFSDTPSSTSDTKCLWSNEILTGTDQACIAEQCQRQCEITLFTTSHDTPQPIAKIEENNTTYNLTAYLSPELRYLAIVNTDTFLYARYEEILEMEVKTFLSALGGSLSLWIGASFMGLVHIIIFFARLPYAYGFVSKKKADSSKPVENGQSRTNPDFTAKPAPIEMNLSLMQSPEKRTEGI